MPTTAAVVGYGSLLKKASTAISEVTKLSAVGIKRDTVEVTNLSSPNQFKEFIVAMCEAQEFTATLNYLPTDATHKQLITDCVAAASAAFATYTATLPNGTSIWSASAAPVEFILGDITPNGDLTATVKFRPTGAWTPPSA